MKAKPKTNYLKAPWRLALRYRKIFIIAAGGLALWFFGVGALTGWLFFRPNIEKFPEITSQDRLLVLAPHIDDETVGAGGLIEEAISQNAGVKVVYLTNGDNNLASAFKEGGLKISPDVFVRLGEQRMEEGKKAALTLGLPENNLYFLGFPDRGLSSLLGKYYNPGSTYASQGTYFSYNPYRGTYREGQVYFGANLVSDLAEIIKDFQPTIIVAPHQRDRHPDHRAGFQFLERTIEETGFNGRVYSYLVHYTDLPNEGNRTDFIFPPKKLFSKTGWFSFDLSQEQENRKGTAVSRYSSQNRDFLEKFVRRNEIFESE